VPKKTLDSGFLATGIGSVPYLEVDQACEEILTALPQIPYWPQLVKRSSLENMNIQQSWHLPLLEVDEQDQSLYIRSTEDMEQELVWFYEHFMAENLEYFAIPPHYAPGLYKMVELSKIEPLTSSRPLYLKGQMSGPLTFGAAISDVENKAVLHNPELMEAMVSALSIKALWQVKKLQESGRKTILFLDEPYLSGFGSAFSPVSREEVIGHLQRVFQFLRERTEVILGIHCCGNTDWAMLLESGPDIINFDAYEYPDYFLLYKDAILEFLAQGGTIAWGIVPTSSFNDAETAERLYEKLMVGLEKIIKWGINEETLFAQSLLTPACGMGTLRPEYASKVHSLLNSLSRLCRTRLLSSEKP